MQDNYLLYSRIFNVVFTALTTMKNHSLKYHALTQNINYLNKFKVILSLYFDNQHGNGSEKNGKHYISFSHVTMLNSNS